MNEETIKIYNQSIKTNKADKIEAFDQLIGALSTGCQYPHEQVQRSLRALADAFTPPKPSAKKTIFGWAAQGVSKDPNKTVLRQIKSDGKAVFSTDGHRGFVAYTKEFKKGYYTANGVPTDEKGRYPDLLGFIPKKHNVMFGIEKLVQSHKDQETSIITCKTCTAIPIDILVTTKFWYEFVSGWEDGAKFYYLDDEKILIIKGKVLGVKCVSVLMPLAKAKD